MQPIARSTFESWRVPPVATDDYPELGPEPVTGSIFRVEERLEQVPYQDPEISPGRYIIIPRPEDDPTEAREIHYIGVQRLVGVGAHWLPTLCLDDDELCLLACREQSIRDGMIVARILERLRRRFLVWLAYCWRTESYRYALSTAAGVSMGSGRIRATIPSFPRIGEDDYHRTQDGIVEGVAEAVMERILSWGEEPEPNLLSRIVSRIPTVVTGTEAHTERPLVGIATPPRGWASWDDWDDDDFLTRFGRAWMHNKPIPCGRIRR